MDFVNESVGWNMRNLPEVDVQNLWRSKNLQIADSGRCFEYDTIEFCFVNKIVRPNWKYFS